jgi:CRISPR/Cas system-associated exonuclease Cas4 (RecB family)
MRTISVSEVGALYDCEARWDFGYGGHLVGGDALTRRLPALTLRRGHAWGVAVAEWHATGDYESARQALGQCLAQDADRQRKHGVYVEVEHRDLHKRLAGLLDHYVTTTQRIPLFGREQELRAPIPSRTGQRASNRYVFHGYVDGLTREHVMPGLWIVEFKLRDRLSTYEQVTWTRQVRWYGWAAERALGERVEGVIVDERLSDAPKGVRWVKGRGKDAPRVPSHAKDQLCTAEAYRAACERAGVDVHEDTFDALAARRWHERHVVILRRDEIERAERELVSAARLVAELDSGRRFPVANPSQFRCPGCAFRDICNTPDDVELIDLDFIRKPPKRLRQEEDPMTQPTLPLEAA